MHCKVNIAFVSVWMRNFWKMLENASVDETSFFKSIWNDVGLALETEFPDKVNSSILSTITGKQ